MATIKDLYHPDWDEMVENWINHIPHGDILGSSPNAKNLVEQVASTKISEFLPDKSLIDIVPGLRERTLKDALILRTKALYHFHASKSLNEIGHSTFTLISMYDACFFSAKSLVYLFGLRDFSRDSKIYLQIFRKEKQKKSHSIVDGHYIYVLEDRLTHNMVWQLFPRLSNTIKGKNPNVITLKSFSRRRFDQFSRERNRYSYESSSWSREDNLMSSDLIYQQTYLENRKYDTSHGIEYAEYYDEYYRTAHIIINIIDEFLSEMAKKAPAINKYLDISPPLPKLKNQVFL
ncbi:hypothetical protein [Gluconobacter kondonii]|uniref:hypothetical protein n=1 Tax=Gluconobacter kondonii TaxID=941463 RepID=UPI001982009C|nr:hypothetical protein [Gluconobacter kondonii]MBN3866418.1 hypothetical protein [Gluconobacter kondonii]